MVIKVLKGNYQTIEKRGVILKTEFLGSGIAVGLIDKEKEIAGLCHFVLPYKEHDLELEEGEAVLSGESLLPIFLEDLKKKGLNFSSAKIAIVGGSKYKESPESLNIGEANFKVAQGYLLKYPVKPDDIILKVGFSCQSYLEVNLKEKTFKINLNGEEEII